MNFKELKLKLKTELKTTTVEIRKLKGERKGSESGYVSGLGSKQWDFRIKHIAYCMLRGTPYEKIESSHRDPHNYSHKYCKNKADALLEEYKKLVEVSDEDVCVSA